MQTVSSKFRTRVVVSIPRLKSLVCSTVLSIAGGRIVGFIPFPRISAQCENANSLVQDSNSGRRVHFLRRYPLHHERLQKILRCIPLDYIAHVRRFELAIMSFYTIDIIMTTQKLSTEFWDSFKQNCLSPGAKFEIFLFLKIPFFVFDCFCEFSELKYTVSGD